MDNYPFSGYDDGAAFQPSQHHDKFVTHDDILNDVQTYSSESGANNEESPGVDDDVTNNPEANSPSLQRAEQELRKTMEGAVQGAAMQLNETLAETKAITQKCLQAITDYVNDLESVHNVWRAILWKEENEKRHLETLLPQVKGATSQFQSAPSKMSHL
jgi:hypothetical protein